MKVLRNSMNHVNFQKVIEENNEIIFSGDVKDFFRSQKQHSLFDLVVTSPPYNIGKEYESAKTLDEYFENQKEVIKAIDRHVKDSGSICWQVGNYINKKDGSIFPLDIGFYKIFNDLGYILKNRIIWHFGHGLHATNRLSGRYETVLWFIKSEDYTFNLDAIRVPQKYPGKTYYKGPNKGKISSNKLGKNPEDVWYIPNVKGNHIEKTEHPCQFPVGLIERLVLGMTNPGDIVFDPYMGVGSAGIAALAHGRKFIGAEIDSKYVKIARKRLKDFKKGDLNYRSHTKEIFDHRKLKIGRAEEYE